MITEVYISTEESHEDSKFNNGLNIKISRADNSHTIDIQLVDDADDFIFHSFEVDFNEFKKAIEKLTS